MTKSLFIRNIFARKEDYIMNKRNFNTLYEEYLKYIELKIKPTTLLQKRRRFNKHIAPFFTTFLIDDVNEKIYIEWQNTLKVLDYSDLFYNSIHCDMKGFYSYLEIFYNLKNIPQLCGRIRNLNKLPTSNRGTWTNKEFKTFIKVVDDPIYHALFNLLYYTGIRKGEAFALKINDLKNGYLDVCKTLTKECFNGKRINLSPKTKKAIRHVQIDNKTKVELNNLCKYYIKLYSKCNSDFYLFGGIKPISPTTLERKKNYYCDLAKVKRIRIHDFRHSHATILYEKGVDIKLIQERLGHSDISITLNTYVHTNERQQKKLIKTINFLRI